MQAKVWEIYRKVSDFFWKAGKQSKTRALATEPGSLSFTFGGFNQHDLSERDSPLAKSGFKPKNLSVVMKFSSLECRGGVGGGGALMGFMEV